MAPEDSRAPFLRIPWAARLINRPGVICREPGCRQRKSDTEDTLMSDIFKTSRTVRSCICFFQLPSSSAEKNEPIDPVSMLATLGDGMNGHPDILHGGIVASLVDESMGIFQGVNSERAHLSNVKVGKAEGELPPQEITTYTAELTVKYLHPVRTPGSIIVTTRRKKKEGRKEWLVAEVKQCANATEDYDGELVTCATGEGLFIRPRASKL